MGNRKVLRLTLTQQMMLADFIKQHYKDKKLADTEFAALASKELQFPLNDNHVAAVRFAIGIPSTMEVTRKQKSETVINRLAACEKAIDELIKRMDAWEK